jgi:hypothetical protein
MNRSELTRSIDRVIHVYQFKCKDKQCGWQGLVVPSASRKRLINILIIAGLSVLLILISVQVYKFLIGMNSSYQTRD